MKVFITWSGEQSKHIAQALHKGIPKLFQLVTPFLSDKDVDKGTQWQSRIVGELESSEMGIICLTPSNLTAPWILFEAGALSKKKDEKEPRVYTYLHNVKPSDIQYPLSMFQHTNSTKEDTRRLLESIRKLTRAERPTEDDLNESFEKLFWPELKKALDDTQPEKNPAPKREMPEMVQEILELVRDVAKTQHKLTAARTVNSVMPEPSFSREVARARTGSLVQKRERLEADLERAQKHARDVMESGISTEESEKNIRMITERIARIDQFLNGELRYPHRLKG